MSKREKRFMMSPNSDASVARTKERARGRDEAAR
jgi:hypothetical protein